MPTQEKKQLDGMFADGRAESPHKKKSWDLKKLGHSIEKSILLKGTLMQI